MCDRLWTEEGCIGGGGWAVGRSGCAGGGGSVGRVASCGDVVVGGGGNISGGDVDVVAGGGVVAAAIIVILSIVVMVVAVRVFVVAGVFVVAVAVAGVVAAVAAVFTSILSLYYTVAFDLRVCVFVRFFFPALPLLWKKRLGLRKKFAVIFFPGTTTLSYSTVPLFYCSAANNRSFNCIYQCVLCF